MKPPVWVLPAAVLALHREQLAEHGGLDGVGGEGALDSALARPRNRAAYNNPDLADLAAAHAFGIVRNHPFADGNKRTALVVAELFLALNGHGLTAADEDCVVALLGLADGSLGESEFAAWLRLNLAKS